MDNGNGNATPAATSSGVGISTGDGAQSATTPGVIIRETPPVQPARVEVSIDGKTLILETGKLARQADGAAFITMGRTQLLATVVSAREVQPYADFLPLTVDYQEKFSATGRLPGGFLKREGRLSDQEILVSRLVDRALRPLFYKDYFADTQVKITLFSAAPETPPAALAGIAASTAIMVSDIPFHGPMAEVRIIQLPDGTFRLFPSAQEAEKAILDIIVGGTATHIVMVEGEMQEVDEKTFLEALQIAHRAIREICQAQEELVNQLGGKKIRDYPRPEEDEEIREAVEEASTEMLAVFEAALPKQERRRRLKEIKERIREQLPEEKRESPLVDRYFHDLEARLIRNLIFEKGIRVDGRKPNEIRPIWMEVDLLHATHGSALFTRGETQALATVTIGARSEFQLIDTPTIQEESTFMVHYNFPPFATGEIKPMRPPTRREIGHGNLALRALKAVMPPEDVLPYTVRVVSDILESNGSSSMATVCAGSLALLDAGVPVKGHVAGIAMGLLLDPDRQRHVILTDILGDEDHIGDMDFKVAGTRNGLTACQMDIKVPGISWEIMAEALHQAREARLRILELMEKVIPEPRPEFKPHAPRTEIVFIPKETIGIVIGAGGQNIQAIQQETGTQIFIEPLEDQGKVYITGPDKESVDKAIEKIQRIAVVPRVGEVYEGTVKEILPFGALVEFLPNRVGLLHISEIDWKRVERIEDYFQVGDTIQVKLIGIDPTGKFRLSRRALLPQPPRAPRTQRRPGHGAERSGGPGGRTATAAGSGRRSPGARRHHSRTTSRLYNFRDEKYS